jgi:hypothetical protein
MAVDWTLNESRIRRWTFYRVARGGPGFKPAFERPHAFETKALQPECRTGTRCFVRSGAVQDNLTYTGASWNDDVQLIRGEPQ